MHAILAVSSRHLHKLQSEITSYPYDVISTQHLQYALSGYRSAFIGGRFAIHLNQNAILSTTFLLAIHAFSVLDFNTQTCSEHKLMIFLRGVWSVIADGPNIAYNGIWKEHVSPPHLLTDLPLMTPGPGKVLLTLLEEKYPHIAFKTSSRRAVYVERIESLASYLSFSSNLDGETLLSFYMRWQCFCPGEFVALVGNYDPVALVILAYFYAATGEVMKQAERRLWWWRERPVYMVKAISEFLGTEWAEWMAWPNRLVVCLEYGCM
jgi:hypothetical protein